MAKVFHTFYSKLYNVSQSEDLEGGQKKNFEIQQYLQGLDFPIVPKGELDQLECPITQEEVIKAIKNMAAGKSPGLDGYTIMYYRRFQRLLLPRLCIYLNTIGDGTKLREETLLTYLPTF